MRDLGGMNLAMVQRDEQLIEDLRTGRPPAADDPAAALLAQLRSGLRDAWDVQVTTPLPSAAIEAALRRDRIRPKRIAAIVAATGLVAACALIGTTVVRDLGRATMHTQPSASTVSRSTDGRVVEALSLMDRVDRRLSAATGTPLPAMAMRGLARMLDRVRALLPAVGHDAERARLALLQARIAALQAATNSPAAEVPAAPTPTDSTAVSHAHSSGGGNEARSSQAVGQSDGDSAGGSSLGDSDGSSRDGPRSGSSDDQSDENPTGGTSSTSSEGGGTQDRSGGGSDKSSDRNSGDDPEGGSDHGSDGGSDDSPGDGGSGGDGQGSDG
jgi:hypothetical protein